MIQSSVKHGSKISDGKLLPWALSCFLIHHNSYWRPIEFSSDHGGELMPVAAVVVSRESACSLPTSSSYEQVSLFMWGGGCVDRYI